MAPKRGLRSNPARRTRLKVNYSDDQNEDTASPPKAHSVPPPFDASQYTQPPRSTQKPNADLLEKLSDHLVSCGVDFGTVNTSASWIKVLKRDAYDLSFVREIQSLRTFDEQIRHPTIVAVQADLENPEHGRVIFAEIATEALNNGYITANDLISFPKFGLIKTFDGIFEDDRQVISVVKARHQRTLKRIGQFKRITAVYPDSPTEELPVTIRNIEDVIVQYLRYFLGLFKQRLAEKLHFDQDEVEVMFAYDNLEVGFAAPAFWKDSMLDSFLHLIERAGWPSRTRIWSEPKAAAIADIALAYTNTNAGSDERSKLQDLYNENLLLFCDIGGASLDTTTLRVVEMTDHTVRLASVAESGGSLCGGRILDDSIEKVIVEKFGSDFDDIRRSVAEDNSKPLDVQDFLKCLRYESCRGNFNGAVGREYVATYGGNNFPREMVKSKGYLTSKGVLLTRDEMIAIHDQYLQKILAQIHLQVTRTRAVVKGSPRVYVVLCGGITRVPYLVDKIRTTLRGKTGIVDIMAVERIDKPLVALGCILCLRQPGFGGRSLAREAYAIPVAKKYVPALHAAQKRKLTGRSDLRYAEARDLADWIAPVGSDASPGTEHSSLYEFDFAILNDDGSPCTSDPRRLSDLSITIEQKILSTSDPAVGREEAPCYKNNPCIHTRQLLRIGLTKEQVMKIDENSKCERIGLFRDKETKQWFFGTAVKVIIDWPDMRMRWRTQVPTNGAFILPGTEDLDPDVEVWEEEIFLVSANVHGVCDGDDLLPTARIQSTSHQRPS